MVDDKIMIKVIALLLAAQLNFIELHDSDRKMIQKALNHELKVGAL